MQITVKRTYEAAEASDGYRVLIDRLWPRGISKEKLALDEWCREVAPSTELRKWFNHEEAKASEFHRRYEVELSGSDAAERLLVRAKASGKATMTLLFSAKTADLSQAPTLKKYLENL